jgi:DNA-binding SARP family transcriptional activator
MLVLLATSSETGMSRDRLLALLWPESDAEHARNALRQTLHGLRRDVALPDVLEGSEILHLNPARISSDLEDFDRAVRAGDHAGAAVAYIGAFLDGFHLPNAGEFERWVEERRAEYLGKAMMSLGSLAADATRTGDFELAVSWWKRLSALDPLNARTAAKLIELLALSGNRPGALQHARVYEALVHDELGSGLDPSLAELLERIRSGTFRPATPTEHEAVEVVSKPALLNTSPATSEHRATFREALGAALADRYQIQEESEGGRDPRARTYLAHDLRHDRQVLLKVIRPSVASLIDFERFLQEIRLTARLRHPHIVPLLDSGAFAGQPWYTTPFLEGCSLRDRLTQGPEISPAEASTLMQELSGALDHAHRHGVVHRDVTPENVLVVDGHALLRNLGFARALDAAGSSRLTESGLIVGSPAYMSPEQAAGEPLVDGRSDVYSLGCLLYEMLTGEPLHTGPSPQAIMNKRKLDPLPSIARLGGERASARAVLLRALAREPAERFATAGEFGKALTLPTGASTSGLPPGIRARANRRRVAVIAIGVLLLVLVAALLRFGFW